MNYWRMLSLAVLFIALGSAGQAAQKDRKGPKIIEGVFRQSSSLFLEDPLNKSARDWARLILLYTLETTDAAVVMGRDEWRWVGVDNSNPHSLQLLAAYEIGNI